MSVERPIKESNMESPRSDHIFRTIEVRKRHEFNHMWSHSTRMFVRYIPRQWIVDLIWWMLRNSLHRRAMSKDCRFGIMACSKSQMVRFVSTIIDYDGLNVYLTIKVIPQPIPCRLEDIFADLRFAKRMPNARFVDLLKTANSWFSFLHERPIKVDETSNECAAYLLCLEKACFGVIMTLLLRRVPVGMVIEEVSSMLTHIHGAMIC